MCLPPLFGPSGGSATQSSGPQKVEPAPALRPPPKPRNIPSPRRVREELDDDDAQLITGKKRSKLKVDKVKSGVKQFDAIDPSINLDAPEQGIPTPK